MAHVARFLLAAAGLDEFVVAPERAVEESDAAGGGSFGPFLIAARDGGSDEDALAFAFENKTNVGFVRRERAAYFFADIVRIRAAEGERRHDERGCVTGIFGEMAAQTAFAGENPPLNRRISAIEYVEDLVFFFEDALQRRGAEEEERLEFAEVQKAHDFVNVSRWQEHAADRRVRRSLLVRAQFGGGDDLCAEVGGSADEEPHLAVVREGDLGLCARGGAELGGSNATAVFAGAVPLWESAACRRTQNLDAHANPAEK